MNDNVLAIHEPQKRPLVARMAERFGVDADKLLTTLKATAFRQKEGKAISNEQMMALLVVADQYDLNPFTKEIYAYEDKGAIVPIVSVDGWARIINSHPRLDGIEFRYSETIVKPDGGKDCPEWCEAVIYRTDRSRPIVVREYLDEVYRKPSFASPWQTHTKRFLRHKALIQGSRVAFGFAGIYDQDEGERILEGQYARVELQERPGATRADTVDQLAERLRGAQEPTPADTEAADDPVKSWLAKLHLAETRDQLDEVLNQAGAELPKGAGWDEVQALYETRALDLI